jgi:hypothetical protein
VAVRLPTPSSEPGSTVGVVFLKVLFCQLNNNCAMCMA